PMIRPMRARCHHSPSQVRPGTTPTAIQTARALMTILTTTCTTSPRSGWPGQPYPGSAAPQTMALNRARAGPPLVVGDTVHPVLGGDDAEAVLHLVEQFRGGIGRQAGHGEVERGAPGAHPHGHVDAGAPVVRRDGAPGL